MREFTQRTGCSNWVANQTLWGQLFLDKFRREHPGWSTTCKQEWGLFCLEHKFHNAASMQRNECLRYSRALQPAEVMAPEHLSMRTLLGSPDAEILKVAEQVYRAECAVVPSILPHRQQDDCMRELHQELTKCMARDGLQGESGLARSTASGRRCSHSHSASWACSPSAGPWGWSQPSD